MRKLLLLVLLCCPTWAATRAAIVTTGNFTTAGTWGTADATSELDSEANNTALTTSYVLSATFTPGAITTSGIMVKVASRAASPTGTFTCSLITGGVTVSGTETAINVSDVDVNGNGWYYFAAQVAGTPTPVLLITATAYSVQCKTSSAAQVNLFRNATAGNWTREVVTTATGAPAAADKLIVAGLWTAAATQTTRTVTMDNTATTIFGAAALPESMAVCKGGTLTFGVAASTAYLYKVAGLIRVFGAGTWNQGTSGTRTPSTSSAKILFSVAANVDSGFRCEAGATCNFYGDNARISKTLLTADAASGQKVMTVASTAGWVANDVLGVAPTNRTYSEAEACTINTVDSGTQVTCVGNLTNAHKGTNGLVAEVINQTRNVSVSGTSATLQGYIFTDTTAVFHGDYSEMTLLGSGTALKIGVEAATTTGSFDCENCSFHDFSFAASGSIAFYTTSTSVCNITLNNSVFYQIRGINGNGAFIELADSSGTCSAITITNNTGILANGGVQNCFDLKNLRGTVTGNSVSGCNSAAGQGALNFITQASGQALGTINTNVAHSNAQYGVHIQVVPTADSTIGSITSWRNASVGVSVDPATATKPGVNLTLDSFTLTGNTGDNLTWNVAASGNIIVSNLTANGDTTFATTDCFDITTGSVNSGLRIINTNMSTASGILTACTNDIDSPGSGSVVQITGANVTLASAHPVLTTAWTNGSYVGIDKYGGTAGAYHYWYLTGQIQNDTGVFHNATPSERLTPVSASYKHQSAKWQVPIANTATTTISVWVNQSASSDASCAANYNGNPARLVLKENAALGINSNTVLATASGSLGSWQQLSGTTAAATGDGTFSAFVDVDGTVGCVYVDDWTATNNQAPGGMKYSLDGLPVGLGNGGAGGGGTFGYVSQ